jgi:hypothetical protein
MLIKHVKSTKKIPKCPGLNEYNDLEEEKILEKDRVLICGPSSQPERKEKGRCFMGFQTREWFRVGSPHLLSGSILGAVIAIYFCILET